MLRGTRFDLSFGSTRVNFTGRQRNATAISGSVPAPTLRWREGDTVTLSGTFFDPGVADFHAIEIDWGQPGVTDVSTFALAAISTLSVNDTVNSTTDSAVLTITDVNTNSGVVKRR